MSFEKQTNCLLRKRITESSDKGNVFLYVTWNINLSFHIWYTEIMIGKFWIMLDLIISWKCSNNVLASLLQMKAHLDLVADALLRWVRGR